MAPGGIKRGELMPQGPLRGALYSQGCPSTRSVNSRRANQRSTSTAHSVRQDVLNQRFLDKSVNTVCQLGPSTRSVNSRRANQRSKSTAHSVRQLGLCTRPLSVNSVRQLGLSTLEPHSAMEGGVRAASLPFGGHLGVLGSHFGAIFGPSVKCFDMQPYDPGGHPGGGRTIIK